MIVEKFPPPLRQFPSDPAHNEPEQRPPHSRDEVVDDCPDAFHASTSRTRRLVRVRYARSPEV